MEIMKRYVVLAASVILFVLVTSGNGDTTANGTVSAVSANDTEEGNTTDKHPNIPNIIHSIVENVMSANLINILPNPIQSFISLVKEISAIRKKIGPRLPNLLLNPISLIITIFPYFVALVTIALTFNPLFILPAKFIGLFFSFLGLFSEYWAPFDKDFLAGL
jgi:hypothetical protein